MEHGRLLPRGHLVDDQDGDGGDSYDYGGTDCDDADANVYVGADEFCNAQDDDCDGEEDEDDALDAPTWYRDLDVDGYGDPSATLVSCDPSGYVADATDCDDTDASVNPGAEDVPDDGIDQDCDGTDLACDVELHITGETSDGLGVAVAGVGDVNDDGFDDALYGAQNVGGTGGAFLVLGGVCPQAMSTLAADATFTGEAIDDAAGVSVAAAGDVNRDGYADMLIGAFANDNGGSRAGAAYLLYGGATVGSRGLADADVVLTGEAANDAVGIAVAGAGDFDGDGSEDLVIGGYNTGGTGAAYIVLGSGLASGSLADAAGKYTGEVADDLAGYAVAGAGDYDGDGIDDVLVGAYGNDDIAERSGVAYLLLGGAPTTMSLGSADARWTGETEQDLAGASLAGGDATGDGYPDAIIGADGDRDGADSAGIVYLVLGGPSPSSGSLSAAEANFTGEAASDGAGYSVSTADVDGDGIADLFIGALQNTDGSTYSGAAYLLFSPVPSGTTSLSAADHKFVGTFGDDAGGAVSGAGDIDADGFDDLLVGASGEGLGGGAYLLLGRGI